MRPHRYYEIHDRDNPQVKRVLETLESMGEASRVNFAGMNDNKVKPEKSNDSKFDEKAYTESLINNEVATAELKDAEAERKIFNNLAKLGVALVPIGVGLSVLISLWFLFTLVGAAAFTFMGVSGRMNDSLQEKRRHEVAARHNMGRHFEMKVQHQLQLTSGDDNDSQ